MSSKKESTSTQQSSQTQATTFDPQSMSAYHSFLPQYQSVLGEYMQNPLMASYFQNQVGMANKRIGQAGQTGITQLMQNLRAGGGGRSIGSPAMQALLMQHQRGQSGQRSDAFMQLLMGAQQNRQWATGAAMGFNPLQTGGTQTGSGTSNTIEKTSGLGTWLPQLAGAGLGFASGFMGGGAKPGAGGGGPAGGAGNFGMGGFNSNPFASNLLNAGQGAFGGAQGGWRPPQTNLYNPYLSR